MNRRRRRPPELSDAERALIDAHLDAHPPRTKPERSPKRSPKRAPTLARLAARGDVPVDRTLDLHGRTLASALAATADTLRQAERHGWTYLKVITGKGHRSPEGQAVLAEEIPAFLRQDPSVAEVVRAVKARDGGAGAWFVRLR